MKKIIFLLNACITFISFSQAIDYMKDPILSQIAQWPTEKPNVAPDSSSMFGNHHQLDKILNEHFKLIVELGSWLGASTRFILNKAPNAIVIAIDHWRGSQEHLHNPSLIPKLNTLYETFIVNCWAYKNRLIPFRTTTIQGLIKISELELYPDLIYVDASHDYDSVTNDLETIYQLFPNTILCGDDWQWGAKENFPVRRAVIDFAQKYTLKVESDTNFWIIKK